MKPTVNKRNVGQSNKAALNIIYYFKLNESRTI